jgi:Ca2+-binding EF-hand superfamily protein
MRKNAAFVLNVLGSALLLTAVLTAQGPGGPGGPGGQRGPGGPGGFRSPLLNALDSNRDGKLSADEIAAAPRSLLKLDINGDGSITLEELQPPPETAIASPDDLATQLMAFDKNEDGQLTADELPARMQSLFTRADTNHDGKLTRDEIRALAARQTLPTGTQKQSSNDPIFLALDTNHDGVISSSEMAAASTSLMTLDKDHDSEISAAEMRPPQATPTEQADHFLGEMDTNKDGKISKAEAPDRMQEQFDALDKNHDGFLDRDELIAYFGSEGGGRSGPPMGQGSMMQGNPGDSR